MFGLLIHSAKEYGLAWLFQRALYEFRVRTGRLRSAYPARDWKPQEWKHWLIPGVDGSPEALFENWKIQDLRFFTGPGCMERVPGILPHVIGNDGQERLLEEADALLDGKFKYFFGSDVEPGFPPDWHLNPITGGRTGQTLHWSKLPMLSPEYGDIKYIWEPGRFASAYLLARAYAVSQEEKYAEGFWQLVESWGEQCPPNTGAHWKCGQEMALRIMAWFFALYVLADSPATTPECFARIIGMIAVQADRILGNHIYAHLQRNNHSMSEGVGVFAAGVLLPFMRKANVWKKRGLEILCNEARLLITPEGTFSQKSNNYHRLMLHDYLYAMRLGEVNGVAFPEDVQERIANAVDIMCRVLDLQSGCVPNFGANDGALVLPLNSCDYTDFRPVCQAGRYFIDRRRWLERGPWDEDLFWLFGPEALDADRSEFEQVNLEKPAGGIYTMRSRNSWVFTHCESFHERPSQADCLHLDFWWKGRNIACDAGTFLYYADPPWNNGLAGTAVHNTVCVDSRDQLVRGPRFIWTRWHKARVLQSEYFPETGITLWEGEHDGYRRLPRPVTHRRTVLGIEDSTWIVVDTLTGKGMHRYRLHWLLEDFDHEQETGSADLTLHTDAGDFSLSARALFPGTGPVENSLVRAAEDGVRGWSSRYYGRREPALSFAVDVEGGLPGRFLTVFSETPAVIDYSAEAWTIRVGKKALELRSAGRGPGVSEGKLVLAFGGNEMTFG